MPKTAPRKSHRHSGESRNLLQSGAKVQEIPAFAGMTVSDTLRDSTSQLSAISDTPRLDAELLMAHALHVSRSTLLLDHLRAEVPPEFAALLQRRVAHEPIAYITGHQEFWALDFAVTPDVLIPRADSETLIEAATETLAAKPPARILDLGTGSGALLLAALSHWPEATGTAIDKSPAALKIARQNAGSLSLADRAVFHEISWHTQGWTDALDGPFDLILCNPPYVEMDAALRPNVRDYEPHDALFAGAEGLDDYRILIPAIASLRRASAPAIFEIGADQAEKVTAIAAQNGLKTHLRHDLAGHPRALILN